MVLLEMLDCACHDWLCLENNDSSEKTKKVRSSDAAKRSIAKPNSLVFFHYFSLTHMQLITPSDVLMAVVIQKLLTCVLTIPWSALYFTILNVPCPFFSD